MNIVNYWPCLQFCQSDTCDLTLVSCVSG